jgi:hypothetical protein
MVGAGHLEKLFEVIDRLSRLALEVLLNSDNELLVGVVDLLLVVILITAGCNHDPLGSPLWPPLVAFVSPLCTFVSRFRRCPSAAALGCHPITLDKNDPDCLLPRAMQGGNVEQFLRGL